MRFTIASILTLCAVAPLVVLAVRQDHQISWIAPIRSQTVQDLLVEQYFERSVTSMIVSGLVVAASMVPWWCKPNRPVNGNRELFVLALARCDVGLPSLSANFLTLLCTKMFRVALFACGSIDEILETDDEVGWDIPHLRLQIDDAIGEIMRIEYRSEARVGRELPALAYTAGEVNAGLRTPANGHEYLEIGLVRARAGVRFNASRTPEQHS